MKKIVLSPSKLSLLKDCPRCFWLDVNKGIKRPSGIFSSLPNGMDLILKKHFDDCRHNNCLPKDIEGRLKGNLFNDMEKLNVWRNNFKGLRYLHESGFALMGAVDDLFVMEDSSIIPLDFKTRGFPLKEDTHEYYQDQMNVYCFLLEKNGLKAGDFACLIFYHPLETKGNGDFKFGIDMVKVKTNKNDGQKLFLDAVEILQGEEPKADDECLWCNWNKN